MDGKAIGREGEREKKRVRWDPWQPELPGSPRPDRARRLPGLPESEAGCLSTYAVFCLSQHIRRDLGREVEQQGLEPAPMQALQKAT